MGKTFFAEFIRAFLDILNRWFVDSCYGNRNPSGFSLLCNFTDNMFFLYLST